MAITDYSYSIVTDTSNAKFDAGKCEDEIHDDAGIAIAVSTISTAGDAITISMKDALSAGEETSLDNLITAHDGEPLIEDVVQLSEVLEEDASASGNYQSKGW